MLARVQPPHLLQKSHIGEGRDGQKRAGRTLSAEFDQLLVQRVHVLLQLPLLLLHVLQVLCQ